MAKLRIKVPTGRRTQNLKAKHIYTNKDQELGSFITTHALLNTLHLVIPSSPSVTLSSVTLIEHNF